jgi:hypothetical protein
MAKKTTTKKTTTRRNKGETANRLSQLGPGVKVLANDVATRPDGAFWVRFRDETEYEIAMWERGQWWVPGMEQGFDDQQLAEIGPRIEPPKKDEP